MNIINGTVNICQSESLITYHCGTWPSVNQYGLKLNILLGLIVLLMREIITLMF